MNDDNILIAKILNKQGDSIAGLSSVVTKLLTIVQGYGNAVADLKKEVNTLKQELEKFANNSVCKQNEHTAHINYLKQEIEKLKNNNV